MDIDSYDVASLAEPERRVIEADSFWSMSLLLDGIQDNYTFAQPGIQTKVTQLKELVQRIDGESGIGGEERDGSGRWRVMEWDLGY